MKYARSLTKSDHHLLESLRGFVPDEVYDIHAHFYHADHFPPGTWPFLQGHDLLGSEEHTAALKRYMDVKRIHSLAFGLPHPDSDRDAMNTWVSAQTKDHATALSRSLLVVSPEDDSRRTAEKLRSGEFCGLKVYHSYAASPDTMNARVTEYAPEWMWEILHETRGLLMLHIVRDGAIDDRSNQDELRRLCRAYPNMRLILAHVARSFNYRNARHGLYQLADLDNVVVDTSAVTESEAFFSALKILGPKRIVWGSDFPVSEMRGRCVTTGSLFYWLHPEQVASGDTSPTNTEMTLVGIESLLTLREACEDAGLNRDDINDIFLNNALRILKPHLPAEAVPAGISGAELWREARQVISGGTGLLSKRAEMFDSDQWPAYFSRSAGCEVWDMEGRRYLDFAGGIGAVLLGYADADVNAAVQRRLLLGTYSSLVNPQEVELARLLLDMHPWAGKVRYARGGGDAMMMSVRIARAKTGRSGVAFCGYHGWHDWYLAANLAADDALDGHLLPGLVPKGVPRELRGTSLPFRYNDLESFERALDSLGDNLAAVVMEPMRSQEPRDGFIEKIASRCRERGGVFVVDEVSSGLRYGFPGALTRMGIEPDIVVYAKAMSNGFPFGVVIGREDVMREADASFISSSYWTDGVGTAAALAVLTKMKRLNVFDVVWQRGVKFKKALEDVASRYPACKMSVGGMPVTPTLAFQVEGISGALRKRFIQKMHTRGILISSSIYLMYAHRDAHIDTLLTSMDAVLKELEEEIKAGNFGPEGPSPDVTPGFARLA